jgi:hypothetical protein
VTQDAPETVQLDEISALPKRRSSAELLAAENHRLRTELEDAQARATVAEEQLLRVHRAVRAAQQTLKNARQKRDEILRGAQQEAANLVAEAQKEALRISRASALSGSAAPEPDLAKLSSVIGGRADWNDPDPSLDQRLQIYLENDLEPDESREWILGERAS